MNIQRLNYTIKVLEGISRGPATYQNGSS